MLSQPKSAVHQQAVKLFQRHWRHLKGNYDLNSAFGKGRQITKTKVSTVFSPNCATNIISHLCSNLPEEIYFNEKLGRHFKNSETTREAYLDLHLSVNIKNSSIHLVTQSL
jgi:hypothetical protein